MAVLALASGKALHRVGVINIFVVVCCCCVDLSLVLLPDVGSVILPTFSWLPPVKTVERGEAVSNAAVAAIAVPGVLSPWRHFLRHLSGHPGAQLVWWGFLLNPSGKGLYPFSAPPLPFFFPLW